MIVQIPGVLTKEEITDFRTHFGKLEWIDGGVTAGHQSVKVKNNLQLDASDPAVQELSAKVIMALERSPLFVSEALPLKVSPPLFNKYQNGGYYGTHIDSAIRQISNTVHRVRTDLSATLFLSDPDEYTGGELIIEDANGTYNIKLPAGSMVLYESGRLHSVSPVTDGARMASFFWVQSMVKSAEQRMILLDLDNTIQNLTNQGADEHMVVKMTSVYHNLLRMWADA